MPPLSITKADLVRLVRITVEAIRVACADAYEPAAPAELRIAA